jgi:hypothetical protein
LVRRPLTDLLYQPRMIDDECGTVGGIKIGRGNRSTQRKPALVPLYPAQILHYLSWVLTRVLIGGYLLIKSNASPGFESNVDGTCFLNEMTSF